MIELISWSLHLPILHYPVRSTIIVKLIKIKLQGIQGGSLVKDMGHFHAIKALGKYSLKPYSVRFAKVIYFYIPFLKEVSSHNISLKTKLLHTVLSCFLILTQQVRCAHACTLQSVNQAHSQNFHLWSVLPIRKLFHFVCSPQQLCKVGSTKLQINELRSKKKPTTTTKWVSTELRVGKQWRWAKNKTKTKTNKQTTTKRDKPSLFLNFKVRVSVFAYFSIIL